MMNGNKAVRGISLSLSEEQDVWRQSVLQHRKYSFTGSVHAHVCVCLFVCILTVCLGMGGRPDGLFVSASSLRMWSVLMYESYRPSPCRAERDKDRQGISV